MFQRRIRRMVSFLCAFALVLGCTGCAQKEKTPEQDSSPLTMYVGLGLTKTGYYEKLRESIQQQLGIEVQYVYTNTLDTSNAMIRRIANGDLPADIVVTAAATPAELQKEAFLDLAAYTNVPDMFTATKIQDIAVDGAVYQIPFTTRLIGIEYNRTLFQEMNWEIPESFDDMVALKAEAEAAGYPFAVSGGVATGHGFNYLMHLMGSEYLSTPDGAEWLRRFRSGEASIDAFAEKAAYFQRYEEAGLFGIFHDQDWNAKDEFSRLRALFYYNIVNDAYSYDGYRYNADGTIFGAQYGADALPLAQENPNGEAVLWEGQYQYDDGREEWKALTHYTLLGAVVLHDEYGSMPWISESGASNCYTAYDNMLIALDKKLGQPEQREKLAKAVQILRFMTSQKAAGIFSDIHADGFMSTHSYTIDTSRMYYDCSESVQKSYLMPWYYNSFDADSIVNVGQKVNDYIKGGSGVTLSDIMAELDYRNDNYAHGTPDIAAVVTETLDYEDSARVQAAAAAMSVQAAMDSAGIAGEITASLMPYTEDIKSLPLVSVPVVQEKFYAGALESALIRSHISGSADYLIAIRMSGQELKELTESGFHTLEDFGCDCVFPYVCVTENGEELSAEKEYLVAVPTRAIESSLLASFEERGAVLMDGTERIVGSTEAGLTAYFSCNPVLSPNTAQQLN